MDILLNSPPKFSFSEMTEFTVKKFFLFSDENVYNKLVLLFLSCSFLFKLFFSGKILEARSKIDCNINERIFNE